MLKKVASSIILPAKTEPIWTLPEPVIKTLCLQMGGAVQVCFQKHHTMNKTCTKLRIVLEFFEDSSSRHSVSKLGGTSRLIKLSKVASSIILPAKTEPIWTLPEPVIKTLCLQMGGGGFASPNPPLSFQAVQACCQEHRTMNKTCIKHKNCFRAFHYSSYRHYVCKRGVRHCFMVYYVLVC